MNDTEQLGFMVDSRVYVLADDADDAIERVKKGEGSVVARKSEPKPEPRPASTQQQRPTTTTGSSA